MNPLRYKLMISYLPGMATIVNSFQSPEVQRAVFDSLMEALNVKMESETTGSGVVAPARPRSSVSAPRLHAASTSPRLSDSAVLEPSTDHAHDLAEGDSIHSMGERQEALP
ncbi:MAG: hypothetical protein JWM11_7617 [Planctomycetaceae bacterium]|nr:hypothetical protein [Planctomycetaceae bacterium]